MASGGLLIYMSTLSPGSGGSSIFAGSEVAFTTADTDLSFLPLSDLAAGIPVTYRCGLLDGDVASSQTADISKGMGFLAAAFDAGLAVLDSNGLIAIDIANSRINPIGWDIWVGDIPAGGSIYDIISLTQLRSVDLRVAEGKIKVVAKSPAYLGNQPLYGVRPTTQTTTSAIDPQNPTEPTDLVTAPVSQFAGIGLGINPVSLKVNPPVLSSKLCWWKETTTKGGDIVGSSPTNAKILSMNLDFQSNPSDPHADGFPADSTMRPGFFAKMKDLTEANRLIAEIANFQAIGYRVILSDGNWFLDIASYAPFNGPLAASFYTWIDSSGANIGAHAIIYSLSPLQSSIVVWFNTTDVEGRIITPPSGVDVTGISIYAVPKSVAISNHQSIVDGFANGEKTVKIGGAESVDSGIQILSPVLASSDSFIGCDYVRDLKIYYDNTLGPGHYPECVLGAIEDANLNGPSYLGLSGGGSLEDVITNPEIGWDGVSTLAYMQGTSSTASTVNAKLQINARLSSADTAASFYTIDTTWKTVVTGGPTGVGTIEGDFGSVGISDPGSVILAGVTVPGTLTARHIAEKNPTYPRWQSSFNSFKDLKAAAVKHPATQFIPHGTYVFHTLRMDFYECFVWGYTNISYSSIYATIYPFWTRGKTSALAVNGNQIICDQGFGAIAADGLIQWQSFTLPSASGGPAQAHGAAASSTGWLLAGEIIGASPCIWSSSDGTTWTQTDIVAWNGYHITRIRWLNSQPITLSSHGHLLHAFTEVTVSAGAYLCDIAWDGASSFVVCGANGRIFYTTDLSTFASVGPGTSGLSLNCAAFWNGYFHVAGSDVSGNGKIYRATPTQAAAGTWTDVTGSDMASANFEDFAAGSLSLIIVSAMGIWATDVAGGAGATWIRTFSDGMYTHPTGYGWNFGAVVATVDSNEIFIVGSSAQIITSDDPSQGASDLPPTWTPWNCPTPGAALEQIRARYFGGLRRRVYGGKYKNWNPVQWSGLYGDTLPQAWGIAFDPPTSTINDYAGMNADAAARKIASEWWAFAGEMSAITLDGSNDSIDENFPELALGNVEDVATIITVQYQPFGGSYLSSAYIQNVDVDRATAGKPDAFFFSGWDATGNTNGLAIWTFCRNAFLKTGILRSTSLTFDSIHDAATLGALWATVDPDLGARIRWLCDRPRYLKQIIHGNDSKAALVQCGCRYKPNTAMLDGRQIPALNSTGYGVVVQADHNYTTGEHSLDIAFPPA